MPQNHSRLNGVRGRPGCGPPRLPAHMHLHALLTAGGLLATAACLLFISTTVTVAGMPGQGTVHQGSPDTRSHSVLKVEVGGGLVHVTAHRVPLRRLLEEIVDRMNLVVVSESPLDRPITVELDGIPLSEGMSRILRQEDFVLYESPASSSGTHPRPGRSSTLWIFAGGGEVNTKAGTITLGERDDDPADIAALQEALLSNDARVRQEAVKALRRLKGHLAIPALAQALADPEEEVRVKAIYGLADIGGEQAAGALTAALGDASPWVRHEAAYALGVTGSEVAAQALRRALRDGDPDVRETAIEAYVDLGGHPAVDGVTMALEDPDDSIRLEAVEALWAIGGDGAARSLGTVLDDRNPKVRAKAVRALGEIGGEAARELLARAATTDGEESIRQSAAALLSALDQ